MKTSCCTICETPVWVEPKSELWRRCHVCDAMVFRAAPGPRIIIAHESEEMSQQLGAVLLADAYWPLRAADGAETLHLVERVNPAAAVLDVGLLRVSTFEVIDRVRGGSNHRDLKIVLLASVFNKTAYKRRPTSLYGADDYVEQHHIPDLLPAKLSRLLHLEPAAVTPAMRDTVERIAAAHQRRELYGPRRVRVLATAIVADIALYHDPEIQASITSGHHNALRGPLAEGRRILAELATHDDYPSPDPIADAFAALLNAVSGSHNHVGEK